jgi:hypothetical protein
MLTSSMAELEQIISKSKERHSNIVDYRKQENIILKHNNNANRTDFSTFKTNQQHIYLFF